MSVLDSGPGIPHTQRRCAPGVTSWNDDPVDLLADWMNVSGGPGRPFVTYYDIHSGERIELSGTTTQNWMAKTANLLVDDLDAGPGSRVQIGLPTHWLRVVWLLATWSVGATVVDTEADVAVVGPDLDLGRSPTARHRVAASLLPLGQPFAEVPDDFIDLGAALPGQPDVFAPFDVAPDDAVAVDVAKRRMTYASLVAETEPLSARVLLQPGSLVHDIAAVVGTALGGGSMVLVSNASDDDIARLAAQEHAEVP